MNASTRETIVKFAVVLLLTIGIRAAAQEQPSASTQTQPVQSAPAAAPAQAAAGQQIPSVIPPFDFKDLFGRVVKADDLKSWIVVYVFGNEDNADTGVEWIKSISRLSPNEKGILYVIVADASKYNKIMYPLVKRVVKEDYRKNILEIKKEFSEKNIPIEFVVEDRYMMTLDLKGDIFKLFGIWDARKINHVFIVDGFRGVSAHFTEYSDAVPAAFGQALKDREAKSNYQIVTHKKKKSMMKRAVYAGALAGLLLLIF